MIKRFTILFTVFIFFHLTGSALCAPEITNADWQIINTCGINGTDSIVYATAYGNGQLFIGGRFSIAGNMFVNKVARWDGEKWSALGTGCNGYVNLLACSNQGVLYAGGVFDSAGGIAASRVAKWDGNSWSALGVGFDKTVTALACDSSGNLYAAVYFDSSSAAQRLSRWNGSTWTAMANGINGHITAIACDHQGDIYIGGTFDSIGGVAARHIAKWDGNIWSPLGEGISGRINAIAVDENGTVAVCGRLDSAGTIKVRYLARWDGEWRRYGLNGESSSITDITALAFNRSGSLFIGGNATSGFSLDFHFLSEWRNNSWNDFGFQYYVSGTVRSLTCDEHGRVYMGGSFSAAIKSGTPVSASNIACWNGEAYQSLDTHALKGSVEALACDKAGNLFIGGGFDSIGGIAAASIVRWKNGTWNALNSGINRSVTSMVVNKSGNLVCAGNFSTAGEISASCIAQWDGEVWSSFATGMNNRVLSLGYDSSGTLFAGGYFDTAGGVRARRIAFWDGTQWNPLDAGFGSTINPTWGYPTSFAFDSYNHLFAGGSFDSAGRGTARNFACWDGSAWNTRIPGPVEGAINVVAISKKDDIFIGCNNGLMRWNGNGWSNMGGIETAVHAIVFDNDGNIYVGGDFASYNHCARFDGTNWSSLGSGTDGPVTCMAIQDSILYIGGSFVIAGGNISPRIASVNIHASASRTTTKPQINEFTRPTVHFAAEYLHIRYNGINYTHIEVFTMAGRRILFRTLQPGTGVDIHIPEMGQGVYLCRMRSEKGYFIKHFIR